MGWRHLSTDEGGVSTWHRWDDNARQSEILTQQPGRVVQQILDGNKLWRDEIRGRNEPRASKGEKIASIPITLWQRWRYDWREHWADVFRWQTYLLRKLHDPAYKNLLTTENPFPDRYERDLGRPALMLPKHLARRLNQEAEAAPVE